MDGSRGPMVEPPSVPMDFVEIETAHAAETKEADDVFDHDEDEGFAHPEAADAEVDASGLLHDDEDVRADEASRPDEPNIAEETNDTVQMFGKVQLCAPQPRCTMIGCLEAPFCKPCRCSYMLPVSGVCASQNPCKKCHSFSF